MLLLMMIRVSYFLWMYEVDGELTVNRTDWSKTHARSLDLIICTVSSHSLPLNNYLRLLRTRGAFVQVGAPEDRLPALSAGAFITKGVQLAGSMIGSPSEIEEMLELAAKKGIRSWVETRPMKDANRAIVDMAEGRARYRYVLANERGAKM